MSQRKLTKKEKQIRAERRFWANVQKTLSGCWLWTASLYKHGYGQFSQGGYCGPKVYAHRYSWELHNGPIPQGLFVCHKCDVRHCVNPDHLFLGTPTDNIRDMWAKGRQGETGAKGSKNCHAKLTEVEVLLLRQHFKEHPRTHKSLAEEFGISKAQVTAIINRKSWAHLPA